MNENEIPTSLIILWLSMPLLYSSVSAWSKYRSKSSEALWPWEAKKYPKKIYKNLKYLIHRDKIYTEIEDKMFFRNLWAPISNSRFGYSVRISEMGETEILEKYLRDRD